jgi:hypothetical protein
LKLLKYPIKHLRDAKADKHSLRIIYVITILTIIPSIYFGYEMIQQNAFSRNANLFVDSHSSIDGAYLLNKNIEPDKRKITLVYGGRDISESQINNIKDQLELFGLKNAALNIKQGFSFLSDKKETDRISQLTQLLNAKEQTINNQNKILDSLAFFEKQTTQILKELRTNYPQIVSVTIKPFVASSDSLMQSTPLVLVHTREYFSRVVQNKIEKWLRVRLDNPKISMRQIH